MEGEVMGGVGMGVTGDIMEEVMGGMGWGTEAIMEAFTEGAAAGEEVRSTMPRTTEDMA
jgi:hypothetical protein